MIKYTDVVEYVDILIRIGHGLKDKKKADVLFKKMQIKKPQTFICSFEIIPDPTNQSSIHISLLKAYQLKGGFISSKIH